MANSSLKPIHVYAHATGPNPWKVIIVLKELDLPYEMELMDMADLKKPAYEKINPNGRVPAIHDPNTDITLWESGAIIEYLAETYPSPKESLTYATGKEKWQVRQWVAFQISGQGPYFGQAAWFTRFHSEQLPSAIARYQDQILRVLYVLNLALEGKEYLVGDRCTIADLSFMPWDNIMPFAFGDAWAAQDVEKKYPSYWAWRTRVMARDGVKEAFEERTTVMATAKH